MRLLLTPSGIANTSIHDALLGYRASRLRSPAPSSFRPRYILPRRCWPYMGGDLQKEQESLRRTGLEVFGRAGALHAAKHRRRMLGPVGPGDRRPAGLGPRLTEIRVAAAVKRSRSPCRCRRTATTNGSRASRTGRSASSPASSTRPTKVPAGASRAAANQTSIDWPSVVPASSSRFVNSLRRVTVARLAATGSR
jgi:hypothetical protein